MHKSLIDWKTTLRFSCRTLSTSSVVPVPNLQFIGTKRSWNIYGSHKCIKQTSSKSLLAPSSVNWQPICCLSDRREPPEFTGEPSMPENDSENKHPQKRLDPSGYNSMLSSIKERSSGLQSLGKQMSERYIQPVTKITPGVSGTSENVSLSKTGKKPDDWNDILNRWYMKYQDFTGITNLKRAQDRVTELSEGLLGTQSRRRNLQAEVEELQEHLTLNHQRITKAELYSEEHYKLFDQARDLNLRLKETRSEFENCERLERDTFTQLSAAIRDCHERERTQAEQSKYWSIIASIVSAALASVITSVNNWVRIREIKDHVSVNNKALLEGYQKMHEDIVGAVNASMVNTATIINEKTESLNPSLVESPKIPVENSKNLSSITDNSSARLSEEDVTLITKGLGDIIKEHISGVLANETKQIQETVKPHLDAIYANLGLILEGNKTLADTVSTSKEVEIKEPGVEQVIKMEMIPPVSADDGMGKPQESRTVVVDYSYKHIASAMAVGAGIGTLATAFILGSFAGGATG